MASPYDTIDVACTECGKIRNLLEKVTLNKKFTGVCNGCVKRRENTGTTIHNGYRLVLMHEHPKSWTNGYVYEHRLVMEKILGRYLEPQVHHKNGDRLDNRPETLELWTRNHGAGVRATDLHQCGGVMKYFYYAALLPFQLKGG